MSPTSEILEVGCSFFPAPQSIAGSSSCHSLKSSCLFLEFVLIRESTVLKRTNESSSSTACSTEHLQVLMSQLPFSGCSLHSPKWKEVFKKYIYISSRSLFTFKILREKKKRSVMPKLLFREITHPVLAWLELFCKPSKPWTCLQIQSWQWLWLSLGRGQKWRLLQLELFKKEKKNPTVIAS